MLVVLIKLICDNYLGMADQAMALGQVHVVHSRLLFHLLFQISASCRLQLSLTSVPQNFAEALSGSVRGWEDSRCAEPASKGFSCR